MHANTQHQWKKWRKKEKNDFSLKTIKPTSCTLGILKFNPHRLNLPLHPFTTPPPDTHTHSAEQNCQGGQISPGVGMLVKGVCVYNCNKQKQTTQK